MLASSSNNVIALHHFGSCENQGVRIDKIWPQVVSIFGNTIPVNDNSNVSSQPPVVVISKSCNELIYNFSGAGSTDTDGQISVYQWSFGDGNTAVGPQVEHTYNAKGNYILTLTVAANTINNDDLISGIVVSNIDCAKDNK